MATPQGKQNGMRMYQQLMYSDARENLEDDHTSSFTLVRVKYGRIPSWIDRNTAILNMHLFYIFGRKNVILHPLLRRPSTIPPPPPRIMKDLSNLSRSLFTLSIYKWCVYLHPSIGSQSRRAHYLYYVESKTCVCVTVLLALHVET